MKKLYFSSILATVLVTTSYANTLKETVTQTVLTNSEILSNQLKVKSNQKDIEIEKSGYYPTLDLDAYLEKSKTKDKNDTPALSTGWEDKDGYRATLKAEQLLFDAGKTTGKVNEEEFSYTESIYKYKQENEDIVLKIIQSYTDLVKYGELDQLMNYNGKAHTDALAVAYDKEEISGEIIETLRTLTLIAIKDDRKLAQEDDIQQALSKYKTLTSIEPVGSVCRPEIDKTLIPSTLEEAITLALTNSSRIKEQKEIIKKQKEVINQKDSAYYPNLKLNLDASYDDDLELEEEGSQKEIIGQVRMNWNFYSGGRDVSTVEKEKIILNEEKKNLEKITKDVVEKVTNLYNTYLKTIQRIDNFDKATKTNQEILALTRNQLEDGTKTFVDILQAKSKIADSQGNKIKQDFILINTYYSLLNEFSILSKTVLTSKDQICESTTLKNLLADDNEETQEIVLDKPMIKPIDTIVDEGFENNISKAFQNNQEVTFDKERLTVTLPITSTTFKKNKLNPDDQFKKLLDSFSYDFITALYNNRSQIKAINIESYSSSEYRSVRGIANKFKANQVLAEKRGKVVKDYLINKAVKEGLDISWFKRNAIVLGKGSLNLIRDEDGNENKVASRRVVLKIIKR